MCWVYILQSEAADKYYIGSSKNPENRLMEHNFGKTRSTKAYVPWKIVFKQKYSSRTEAVRVESKLKKYKNKEIIRRIIQEQTILGH